MRYEGAARELVLALKYRNTRPALDRVARAMAAVAAPHAPDAVTLRGPPTPARRRERGYDQAQLLARGVARGLQMPLVRLLERCAGPAQTGRDRAERLTGPRLVARRSHAGAVLVVDDVCTTGATLAAAAVALRHAGAEAVHGCTLRRDTWRTPDPDRSRPRPGRPKMAWEERWNLTTNGRWMQPTDVQVERTLAALQDAPSEARSGRASGGIDRAALGDVLGELPDGLLDGLETGPSLRPDRLAEARGRPGHRRGADRRRARQPHRGSPRVRPPRRPHLIASSKPAPAGGTGTSTGRPPPLRTRSCGRGSAAPQRWRRPARRRCPRACRRTPPRCWPTRWSRAGRAG